MPLRRLPDALLSIACSIPGILALGVMALEEPRHDRCKSGHHAAELHTWLCDFDVRESDLDSDHVRIAAWGAVAGSDQGLALSNDDRVMSLWGLKL